MQLRLVMIAVAFLLVGGPSFAAPPEPPPVIVGVQPASMWEVTNPPPDNPHMLPLTDVTTPVGPGVREDAFGGTDLFCENAHANRSFPLSQPLSAQQTLLSFYYEAGQTGVYVTTSMHLSFYLLGAQVGQTQVIRALDPPNGVNGSDPVEFPVTHVASGAVATLELGVLLGNVQFNEIRVQLNQYGCQMTGFQVLSGFTLSSRLTPSQRIERLLLLVETLPASARHIQNALIHQLRAALNAAGDAELSSQAGDFRRAEKAFNRAAKQLGAVKHLLLAQQNRIVAAAGQALFDGLLAEAEGAEKNLKKEALDELKAQAFQKICKEVEDLKKKIDKNRDLTPEDKDRRKAEVDEFKEKARDYLERFSVSEEQIKNIQDRAIEMLPFFNSTWFGKFKVFIFGVTNEDDIFFDDHPVRPLLPPGGPAVVTASVLVLPGTDVVFGAPEVTSVCGASIAPSWSVDGPVRDPESGLDLHTATAKFSFRDCVACDVVIVTATVKANKSTCKRSLFIHLARPPRPIP